MTTPPATPQPTRGIIHVAIGPRYVEEARRSAESVRRTNPGLPVWLLTDDPPPTPHPWDGILTTEARLPGSATKLHMDRAPWDRCLFLDTDTLVLGSLAPAFALLDRFDLAAMQHSGGHHYQLPGLPSSFPEFNSGVIAWRRGPKVSAFFARWRELYGQMLEPAGRTWDQKSLRLALYESDLRIASLPHAYNLMPYFPATVEGPAVILHGRNPANLERLAARMARSRELRAYVPGVGALRHPCHMSWPDLLRSVARLLALKLRRVRRGGPVSR